MEIGKDFRNTPTCLSKPLCVYVCTIIIHIICESHAETRGQRGRQSTAEKREKGRVLTPYISKIGRKLLFCKQTVAAGISTSVEACLFNKIFKKLKNQKCDLFLKTANYTNPSL